MVEEPDGSPDKSGGSAKSTITVFEVPDSVEPTKYVLKKRLALTGYLVVNVVEV